MRFRLIIAAMIVPAIFPAAAWAWPWSTDMANQPSIKPQEPISNQEMEMKPFPKRSVPVDGIPTTVSNRDEANSLKNPVPPTEASIRTGRTLFRIYCSACHGLTGQADSPVTPKIGAIPLVSDRVQKELTEGWIFGTISFGSYVMPAYGVPEARQDQRGANDLTVEERWDVVNYVRHGLVKDAEAAKVQTAAAPVSGTH
jgi:mono/diheme cytochrome c family protein